MLGQLGKMNRINHGIISIRILTQKCNPIADLKTLDLRSNLDNLSRPLTTRDQGCRSRVVSRPLIDVDVVDAGIGDLDEDLRGFWDGPGDVGGLEG